MKLDLNGKWIPVFRTGKHVSGSGASKEYTRADLDTMVTMYNEQSGGHIAPVVVGHPADNAPAYGWAKELRRVGDTLEANLEKVPSEFSELVEQGRYRTRSIAHYPNMLLRHIGFLGAMPPAIKGIPNVAYNYDDGGQEIVVTDGVEFSEEIDTNGKDVQAGQSLQNRLMNAIKNVFQFSEKSSSNNGGNTPNEEDELDVKELEKKVDSLAVTVGTLATTVSAYSEVQTETTALLKAVQKNLTDSQKALETSAANSRKAGFQEFAENLVKAGKMTPAQTAQAVSLLETAYQADSATFSEGGENKTPLVDAQKALMSSAGSVISFGETATQGASQTPAPGVPAKGNEFAEYKNVNSELLDLDNRALAYAEQNKVTYEAALDHVRNS